LRKDNTKKKERKKERKERKRKRTKRKENRNFLTNVQHQLCIVLSLSCQLHSQLIIVWTPSLAAFSFALKLLLFALAQLSTDFARIPWSTCLSFIVSLSALFVLQ
jgi:hypothetical protein